MTDPSLKERAKRVYGGVASPPSEPELYQDAVRRPCVPTFGNIDDESGVAQVQPPKPGQSSTDALLQRLLDISGGGSVGGTYRSINLTVPALEQRYEIPLGIYATQLSLRCDKPITLVMNNPAFDTIFLEIADFPVSISELRLNESIHTLYVTTGTDITTIKIFALGSVKQS